MLASNGRSIYEDDSAFFMTEAQSGYYRDDSTIDAARQKLRWVASLSRQGGRLLDVGANFGFFAKDASAIFDVVGMEPSPQVVAWGRTHLLAPIEVGSIDEERPDYIGRFDAITMFDVIEHLPNPRATLERCRRYLAQGGRLFITTPDSGSLMARLFGRSWYYVDLVEHISLFNATNLIGLLEATGFRLIHRRTIGRRYKLSYIEHRLGQIAADSLLLRTIHVISLPLRVLTGVRVPLNLGDVVGLVVERRD
jgi:SAM-dependent methyltransferase